jgi:predicted MFS family arabinose efflux permease
MYFRPPSERTALVGGLLLVVIGGSMFNILPLLTAGAAEKLGFSTQQAGLMSAILTVSSGLSALLAGAWVRSLSWPRVAAGSLGGMTLCLLVALSARDYWAFVSMQGIAAFCGSAAFALGMAIISDRPEATRGFGLAICGQIVYQIAVLWAGPFLLRELSGVDAILALLALPAGLAVPLAPLLPVQRRSMPGAVPGNLARPATLIALLSYAIYYIGTGAYWTYIELIGQDQRIAAPVIAKCVALSVVAGIPGALLAWAQGSRLGNLWPIALAACLRLLAPLLLAKASGALAFGTAGILYFLSTCYSLAYQCELINVVDISGRAVPLAGAFAFFGSTVGAALPALFTGSSISNAVVWILAISTCVSVAMSSLSLKIHEHRAYASCSGWVAARFR